MRPDAKHRVFQHSGNNRDNTGRPSYKAVRKDGFNEDSPKKEGMRKHYGTWGDSTRSYDYKLIRNFLIGNSGRCWNDVYSELCRMIDKRIPGAVWIHKDVLERQVHLKVEEKNGKVYSLSHHRWNRNRELIDKDLYVDSKGILRVYKRTKIKYRAWKRHFKYPITHTSFGDFLFIEGLWYRVKMVEPAFIKESATDGYFTRNVEYTTQNDVILVGRMDYGRLDKETLVSAYGEPKICISKLAANKNEIKKLKKLLEN